MTTGSAVSKESAPHLPTYELMMELILSKIGTVSHANRQDRDIDIFGEETARTDPEDPVVPDSTTRAHTKKKTEHAAAAGS